jgi:NAD(P)-dependent dehydrogenase (short-subunit alcohol dehydrogenase family)
MKIQLKPISEQTIVMTGASSGIGLVTAKMAAQQGACVVLAARNANALAAAVAEIRRKGGRAIGVTADVSDPAQVDLIASAALREFSRIDTWVNNAAVSMYGRIMEISLEDMRRQMDVNYWGQVYGSLAAVRHLRNDGGALINVGSAVSDRAIPLQGPYCAAKHALKGFTDTLRMELEAEGAPISVSLVKPGSIDTPFFDKAKNYLDVEPQPAPPVYAPEIVASVILTCAREPVREIVAGGSAELIGLARLAPRIADWYMERSLFESQETDIPATSRADNLYAPVPDDGGERGQNWKGRTRGTSLVTSAVLRPGRAAAVAGGVAAAAALAFATRRRAA